MIAGHDLVLPNLCSVDVKQCLGHLYSETRRYLTDAWNTQQEIHALAEPTKLLAKTSVY